jgi:hypothetical protein
MQANMAYGVQKLKNKLAAERDWKRDWRAALA